MDTNHPIPNLQKRSPKKNYWGQFIPMPDKEELPMVIVVGLGASGSKVVEEIQTRHNRSNIGCIAASNNIDHLRIAGMKNKILIKDGDSSKKLLNRLKGAEHIILVGDLLLLGLWRSVLNRISSKTERHIFSFVLPITSQTKNESDRDFAQISSLSTRALAIPMDLFKIYTGKLSKPTEIEAISQQFAKLAVNSFLYILEQFVLSNPDGGGKTKRILFSSGKMCVSVGSDSSESVKEAYNSPIFSEHDLNSARMKLLHVQFNRQISLQTASMLAKWMHKHQIDIHPEHVLMERNMNVEDVALARLWLFE